MEHRRIELAGGLAALVDPEDYARLRRYAYYPNRLPDGSLLVCRKATAGGVGRNGRRGHRLLAHDVLELPPRSRVKYLSGDRLDCRKANLRAQGGCVQQVGGAAHRRKPFRVMVTVGRRRYHLGYYPRPDMAAWAAREADRVARELRGRRLRPAEVQRELDLAVGREA